VYMLFVIGDFSEVILAKHSHCHPVVDDDDDNESVYMRFVFGVSYQS